MKHNFVKKIFLQISFLQKKKNQHTMFKQIFKKSVFCRLAFQKISEFFAPNIHAYTWNKTMEQNLKQIIMLLTNSLCLPEFWRCSNLFFKNINCLQVDQSRENMDHYAAFTDCISLSIGQPSVSNRKCNNVCSTEGNEHVQLYVKTRR